MNQDRLKALLQEVADGRVAVEAALENLKVLPYEDMEFAKVDSHRAVRDNFPEVVFCPGKRPQEVASILLKIGEHGNNALATRATPQVFEEVSRYLPEAVYHERAGLITLLRHPVAKRGSVAVVSAGTADMPVAEEAAISLDFMGTEVLRVYDVGVAGLHRLLDRLHDINRAQAVIVVAGMEGALASVIGGMTARPVVAVPTSIGYGASFGGLAALLSMLNSCATGVGVVNIDNGFGAAALAYSIVRVAYPG